MDQFRLSLSQPIEAIFPGATVEDKSLVYVGVALAAVGLVVMSGARKKN